MNPRTPGVGRENGTMDASELAPSGSANAPRSVESFGLRGTADWSERPAPTDERLDFSTSIGRMDGDVEIFKELAQFFLRDSQKLLVSLQTAIDAGDFELVERSAHSVKGLASNFDAHRAVEIARTLETMGRSRNLTGAASTFDELSQAVEALSRQLREFCETQAA